jgi:hypothetical protein
MVRALSVVSLGACKLNRKYNLKITLGPFLPHAFHMTPYCLVDYTAFQKAEIFSLSLHRCSYHFRSLSMSVRPSIHLSNYSSTALVGLGPFFSFLIYTQSVGLLGQGISTE